MDSQHHTHLHDQLPSSRHHDHKRLEAEVQTDDDGGGGGSRERVDGGDGDDDDGPHDDQDDQHDGDDDDERDVADSQPCHRRRPEAPSSYLRHRHAS